MTFNSIQYVVFLLLVIGVVWSIRSRWRNPVILLASYAFYASWDWRFLGLIVVSTLIGYTSGLALEGTDDETKRKEILAVRIVLNLALLGVFKYANFFLDSGAGVLRLAGVDVNNPALRIILPIAISYMTFEEIAYAMDVYRRDIRATHNLVHYAIFVAFFPKLVAGPILRPKELLPQIADDRPPPDRDMVREGVWLILLGLVKKVVLADSMARVADEAFNNPDSFGSVGLIVGVYAFAIQIYGDFSGYTDIARGSAQLLGFHLPLNFRQPYLSNSITAFWKTWHISLSSWLRDYLYIPLGGNRRGPRRTMVNLFTVMVLGGLWHGAGWTFVVWGALHGGYLAFERWRSIDVRHDNSARPPRIADLWRIFVTFHLVCLAWIAFRAPTIGSAWDYLSNMADLRSPLQGAGGAVLLVPVAAAVILIDLWQRRTGAEVPSSNSPARNGALVAAGATAIVLFSGAATVPFIYFQF
jgi:alginate O-acetyltransferase complex protein AlgI